MSEEFFEPARQGRRNLLLAIAALAIGFLLVQGWAIPAFSDYINALPLCERIPVLETTMNAILLFPLAAGTWGVLRARRLIRLEQFPLPGDRVWRRTPVTRGRAVRRKGFVLLALSVALLALPIGGWLFADSLFTSLKAQFRCADGVPQDAASFQHPRQLRAVQSD